MSMGMFSFIGFGGVLKENYAENVVGDNSAVTRTITVPTGKRWMILAGHIKNGDTDSRNLSVYVLNAADKVLFDIYSEASVPAGTRKTFPKNTTGNGDLNPSVIIVKEGQKVVFYWAASAGGTGGTNTSALVVLEVPE